MAARIVASIAICTRNRAVGLRDTLASIVESGLSSDIPTEVLVVDNASSDDTREVVAAWRPQGLEVRYVSEPRVGTARARNAALATARGDVILFIDDDVRPPPRWLEAMCRPILGGATDAVAGGVRLAAHLERPWMEPVHRSWLADTAYIDPRAPQEMVTANMAIGRHVLAQVPAFDPELGPGGLGQGEDALFSWQLLRAGFRIAGALDLRAEHHCAPARLFRTSFRDAAEKRGRTRAYQQHHWEHVEMPDAADRLRRLRVRFLLARLRRWRPHRSQEGMPAWEMMARAELACLQQWPIERARRRNYERFGLVKLA